MKKIFFLLFTSSFLRGEFSADGEFYVCTTPVFSITIDVRTLSFAFSGQTAKTKMGEYTVTVTNTITTGTHDVLLYSTVASDFSEGSTIEARNSTSDGTVDADTIELVIENTPGVDGTGGPEEVAQGESIRTFTGGDTATSEDHTIEVYSVANTLNGKPAGNYRTLLYLALSSS